MTDTTTVTLEDKSILIIDDEEFTVSPAISLLESMGATVRFEDSLANGLSLLKKGGEEAFDLVVLDLRFTNGLPTTLRRYLEQPDEDTAFQRYGVAMGEWLKKKHPSKPFVYYTILPNRTGDPKVTVDKLKGGPLALLDTVRDRLQPEGRAI